MTGRLLSLLFAFVCVLITGCAAVAPRDFAGESPKLDLAQYFNGRVEGWGMVQDRSGRVLRRMVVEMNCTWTGDEGVLDESFRWSDGKTEKRVWKIRKNGDRYTGTAGDVIGEADGLAAGNALQWRYVLKLPADAGGHEMNMDDWMWMIDEKTVTNRTTMSKLGVRFAEITIFFRKR